MSSACLQLCALITPRSPHRVLLGSESGDLAVFLQLGPGHLVRERSVAAHRAGVTCLAAGVNILVSASQDGSAKLWSLGQEEVVGHLRDLQGHQSPVSPQSSSSANVILTELILDHLCPALLSSLHHGLSRLGENRPDMEH